MELIQFWSRILGSILCGMSVETTDAFALGSEPGR